MSIKLETKQTGTEFIFINGELVAINQIKKSKLVKKSWMPKWLKIGLIMLAQAIIAILIFGKMTASEIWYIGILNGLAASVFEDLLFKK